MEEFGSKQSGTITQTVIARDFVNPLCGRGDVGYRAKRRPHDVAIVFED